jgi:hypothetical protein
MEHPLHRDRDWGWGGGASSALEPTCSQSRRHVCRPPQQSANRDISKRDAGAGWPMGREGSWQGAPDSDKPGGWAAVRDSWKRESQRKSNGQRRCPAQGGRPTLDSGTSRGWAPVLLVREMPRTPWTLRLTCRSAGAHKGRVSSQCPVRAIRVARLNEPMDRKIPSISK